VLDATGKAEWRRVARLMTDAGVLTQADRGVLTLYCSAWSQWVKAKKELRKKGKGEVLAAAKGGTTRTLAGDRERAGRRLRSWAR